MKRGGGEKRIDIEGRRANRGERKELRKGGEEEG